MKEVRFTIAAIGSVIEFRREYSDGGLDDSFYLSHSEFEKLLNRKDELLSSLSEFEGKMRAAKRLELEAKRAEIDKELATLQ